MKQTIAPPTQLAEVPAYREAADKLARLNKIESQLKSDIAATERQLNRDPDYARGEATTAVLAGESYQDSLRGQQELAVKLRRLREEAIVMRRAISQQEAVVGSVRATASQAICEGVKAEHTAVQREMVLGLIAAQSAALRTRSIRNRLDSNDVSISSLPVLRFEELEQAAVDSEARLPHLIREALGSGLIQRADVPTALLQLWAI